MTHINILDLDITKIGIAKIGRNIKLIDLNTQKPLEIVTDKMYIPFGIKCNKNNYNSFDNCYIDCSLNQSKTQISVRCKKSFELLDEHIKTLILNNTNLFKDADITNIDIDYAPVLRENKTFPKLIKLNLSRDGQGNFTSFVFDENNEKIWIDDTNIHDIIPKNKIFIGIITCNRIWYFNGRFGTSWDIKQLKLTSQSNDNSNNNVNNTETNYAKLMID